MIDTILTTLLSGIPILVLHFIATVGIWMISVIIYLHFTPHHETTLIKNGNVAASLSISGVYLGFAIPLAFCLAGSLNVIDLILWGVTILVLQILIYVVIDFTMKDLSARIERGEIAIALYLTIIKLSIAILLAGSISV